MRGARARRLCGCAGVLGGGVRGGAFMADGRGRRLGRLGVGVRLRGGGISRRGVAGLQEVVDDGAHEDFLRREMLLG